jgi:hypothetical protein
LEHGNGIMDSKDRKSPATTRCVSGTTATGEHGRKSQGQWPPTVSYSRGARPAASAPSLPHVTFTQTDLLETRARRDENRPNRAKNLQIQRPRPTLPRTRTRSAPPSAQPRASAAQISNRGTGDRVERSSSRRLTLPTPCDREPRRADLPKRNGRSRTGGGAEREKFETRARPPPPRQIGPSRSHSTAGRRAPPPSRSRTTDPSTYNTSRNCLLPSPRPAPREPKSC